MDRNDVDYTHDMSDDDLLMLGQIFKEHRSASDAEENRRLLFRGNPSNGRIPMFYKFSLSPQTISKIERGEVVADRSIDQIRYIIHFPTLLRVHKDAQRTIQSYSDSDLLDELQRRLTNHT